MWDSKYSVFHCQLFTMKQTHIYAPWIDKQEEIKFISNITMFYYIRIFVASTIVHYTTGYALFLNILVKHNILLKSTTLHCQPSSTGLSVFTKLAGDVTWVFSTIICQSSACKGLAERDEGRALVLHLLN